MTLSEKLEILRAKYSKNASVCARAGVAPWPYFPFLKLIKKRNRGVTQKRHKPIRCCFEYNFNSSTWGQHSPDNNCPADIVHTTSSKLLSMSLLSVHGSDSILGDLKVRTFTPLEVPLQPVKGFVRLYHAVGVSCLHGDHLLPLHDQRG